MAFTRPTLTEIIDRIKSDYKSGLSLQTILRRSFLDVFAKAFGGASHTLHGHIDYGINTKFFPDTGDIETVTRWGTLYNLPRNEATRAELTIDVTGTTGNTLPAGTIFVRSDGVEYAVDSEVTVPASSTVSATIVATEEFAGSDANMANGDDVSLQSPISGIESDATVTATTVEGEDQETPENYRIRVLERLRFPPSGGTVTDYIAYAKTVTGVTRAWVLPNYFGQGTVGLTFVEDGNLPASIIPSSAKVDEVQEAVLPLKPVTAELTTFAPSETQMNPEIQLKPNTSDVRAAVTAELEDLISRDAEVRNAADPERVGDGITFDGKIRLSKINEAISIASGEEDHVLVSPTSDVQPASGGIVTLGTITFSTLP